MIRRAILLLAVVVAAQPVFACAPAPRAGEEISTVEESAVIVWEPATKTQHFIRRATFRGTAKDFGFLVPTPTAPALAEVDDRIFDVLNTKTARKTVYKTSRAIDWTPLLLYSRLKSEGNTAAGRAPVEVLDTKKIAGYEAAVLDATDAAALSRWLDEHGYATTPDLAEWLDAYVKQGWKITAFKIDKSADAMARTSAVKMSFQTERPFFPYREPASQRANAKYGDVRVLRIWFLGPERVKGVIGANEFWPGVLMWSDRVDSVAGLTIPANTRLTALNDTSSIRPGTDDLFFTRDADQNPHIPPPYVDETVDRIPVPLDVAGLLIVVVGLGMWRWKRRA